MDIENRKKQLENLNRFINGSLNKLNSILDFMGWEAEKVIEVWLWDLSVYNIKLI